MVERRRVVPALRERVEDVRHRGAADLRHGVVPRRGRAVPFVQRRGLWIARVLCVVTPTVTEVDASDERDVFLGPALPAYDQELLVVGPAPAHPLVEERLPAALVDDGAEVVVLLAVEPARVRAPQQRAHLDAATPRLTTGARRRSGPLPSSARQRRRASRSGRSGPRNRSTR